MKTCSKCGKLKRSSSFAKGRLCKECHKIYQRSWRKRNPGKYAEYCKTWRENHPGSQLKSSQAWVADNPDYHKDYHLQRRYGISLETYNEMVKAQDGKCAICGKECKLYVDHNHTTGKVRELLCREHNVGMGHFQEDPELLRAAATYLEKHSPLVATP